MWPYLNHWLLFQCTSLKEGAMRCLFPCCRWCQPNDKNRPGSFQGLKCHRRPQSASLLGQEMQPPGQAYGPRLNLLDLMPEA